MKLKGRKIMMSFTATTFFAALAMLFISPTGSIVPTQYPRGRFSELQPLGFSNDHTAQEDAEVSRFQIYAASEDIPQLKQEAAHIRKDVFNTTESPPSNERAHVIDLVPLAGKHTIQPITYSGGAETFFNKSETTKEPKASTPTPVGGGAVASSGSDSPNDGSHTPPTEDGNLWSWNPSAEDLPDESQKLKHEKVAPPDFVGTPNLGNEEVNSVLVANIAESGKTGDIHPRPQGCQDTPEPPAGNIDAPEKSDGGASVSCIYKVAGVEVDASYIDSKCVKTINIVHTRHSGQFNIRRLLLKNTTKQPLTVVIRTVNGRPPPMKVDNPDLIKDMLGPSSFLQTFEGDAAAVATTNYIAGILKDMVKVQRKHPESSIELIITFSSPLDSSSSETESGETPTVPSSFMQTEIGAARMNQACIQVLSLVDKDSRYQCEMLENIDMGILHFPPNADVTLGGKVDAMLRKLIELEGRSIHFWEVSHEAVLQMLPADVDLPEPPTRFSNKPAFVEAKAEIEQQCSSTQKTRVPAPSSPVGADLPSDPDLTDKLWGMYAIRCVHAWLQGETGHRNIKVGVVDSGIAKHPELQPNAWKNPGETVDRKDNDKNGLIDDIEGWNFSSNDSNTDDTNGHGTHVAGTIGAVVNGESIVGCSPLVSLIKIRQFGANGRGTMSNSVRGVAYALLHDAHVINNSWGGEGTSKALDVLFQRSLYMRNGLGALMVNAAGNAGSNNDEIPFYPAAFSGPNMITVGAYNVDGDLASFSNYGEKSVHVIAPGERIYSAAPGNAYAYLSGTSMATPHVSGVAALIFSVFEKANSNVSAAEVKDIIRATMQMHPAAENVTKWGGVPDALRAVLMARLGGMWCQMKCTDMIVDLKPGETYAPTLFVRGYQIGVYKADIQVQVFDKEDDKGNIQFPFTLKGQEIPDPNVPPDEEASSAFYSSTVELDHANPLCDVQLNYAGTLGVQEEVKTLSIVGIVLGSVTAVAAVILLAFLVYYYMSKRNTTQDKAAEPKRKPKAGAKGEDKEGTVVVDDMLMEDYEES